MAFATIFLAVAALLAALILIAVFRALRHRPPFRRTSGRPAREPLSVSGDLRDFTLPGGAAERLAAAIRIPTVTYVEERKIDLARHREFLDFLESGYPLCHEKIFLKRFGDMGILFRFPGSDPDLKPCLFLAHYDVVPAGEGTWERAPFSGDLAGGYIWGRGSLDDKISLISIMEAAEALLAEGKVPERTTYLAFGGDEEIGGVLGAKKIAAFLAAEGVRLEYLNDEGLVIVDGLVSLVKKPLALIGISEKGYVDFRVFARGEGGHASMPPSRTAGVRLAAALTAIDRRPFPSRLTYTVKAFLDALSDEASFPLRLVFRNLWLTAPLVRAIFAKSATTNAMIRTTTVPTVLVGSDKENVLPELAYANLNARVLPGETIASALERIRATVKAAGAEAEVAWPEKTNESLGESPVDAFGYRAIEAVLAAIAPEGARVPSLVTGSTDSHHFADSAETIYRIVPVKLTQDDLPRIHGVDERASIDDLRRCVAFYYGLLTIRRAAVKLPAVKPPAVRPPDS